MATVEELAAYLGREIVAGERERAELMLELAAGAVAGELGITAGALETEPPAGAKGAILAVAARALENPLTLQSESVGPWSGSYTAGGLELTNQERAMLGRSAAGKASGVYDVSIGAPDRYHVDRERDGSWPDWVANA